MNSNDRVQRWRQRQREARTLGRVAYLAYWLVLGPLAIPWDALSQREQRAWQAAAQAAIAAHTAGASA